MPSNYSNEDLAYARRMTKAILDDIEANTKHSTLQSAIEDARRLVEEARARAIANYDSHRWNSVQQTCDPYEWETYCMDCGCENRGDPREFSDLQYPHCDDGILNDDLSETMNSL